MDAADLPGRPDVVFPREKVAVFCDGDFWHGRDLATRMARLAKGHIAPYWVATIETNAARDRRHNSALEAQGWLVLRYWESDVLRDPGTVAAFVRDAVLARRQRTRQS